MLLAKVAAFGTSPGAGIAGYGVSRVGGVDAAGVLAFAVAGVCGVLLVYCTWLSVTVGACCVGMA